MVHGRVRGARVVDGQEVDEPVGLGLRPVPASDDREPPRVVGGRPLADVAGQVEVAVGPDVAGHGAGGDRRAEAEAIGNLRRLEVRQRVRARRSPRQVTARIRVRSADDRRAAAHGLLPLQARRQPLAGHRAQHRGVAAGDGRDRPRRLAALIELIGVGIQRQRVARRDQRRSHRLREAVRHLRPVEGVPRQDRLALGLPLVARHLRRRLAHAARDERPRRDVDHARARALAGRHAEIERRRRPAAAVAGQAADRHDRRRARPAGAIDAVDHQDGWAAARDDQLGADSPGRRRLRPAREIAWRERRAWPRVVSRIGPHQRPGEARGRGVGGGQRHWIPVERADHQQAPAEIAVAHRELATAQVPLGLPAHGQEADHAERDERGRHQRDPASPDRPPRRGDQPGGRAAWHAGARRPLLIERGEIGGGDVRHDLAQLGGGEQLEAIRAWVAQVIADALERVGAG